MDELKQRLSDAVEETIIKATLSNKRYTAFRYNKTSVRKIVLKEKELFQLEHFTDKQAFHENVEPTALCDKLYDLMKDGYKQCDIWTADSVISIKAAKSGTVLFSKKQTGTKHVPENQHNRQKSYLLKEGDYIPALFDLGVITSDGKVIQSKYDKYKQINRFAEFIDDIVSKDKRDCYNIIDFGCGKSYLTFVLYHYMTVIAKKKVTITGLDLKKEVIDKCNALTEKYGYQDLNFLCGDIKDYRPKERPDMVISLHACDVATDYALYNAYLWQADYILSVPCCQHEMNANLVAPNLAMLTDYGIIKERFCALATDAMRGKLLEYCGYEVDLLEFIDISHSPKNILIRAKRKESILFEKREKILQEINSFQKEFKAEQTLYQLAVKRHNISCKEKDFLCVTGNASMLLADSGYIRKEVFVKEQHVPIENEFDEFDCESIFLVLYDRNLPIATGRAFKKNDAGEYKLGRFAVLKNYRRLGIGAVMVRTLEAILIKQGGCAAYLSAQTHALEFYRKLGFVQSGDEYLEENIPHYAMKKTYES